MLADSNVREEYVLQEDEDGCTVAVQYFAGAWNMVETKLMNGELVFIIIMKSISYYCYTFLYSGYFCGNPHSYIIARHVHTSPAHHHLLTVGSVVSLFVSDLSV